VVETAGRLYVDGFMVDESDWTRVHGEPPPAAADGFHVAGYPRLHA
jgi:hypothetical protein